MRKKIFLQIFLLLIILFISIIFFKAYFGNNITVGSLDNNKIKSDNLLKKESNLIYNIQYISKDKEGNSYIINSEFGEVDSDKQEIVYLKKVTATINMKNSEPINIYADNAVYNNINYNTNFYENITVVYSEHHITSDNLDLNFKKNLATVFNNISYKNLNTKLQADKIEIDLITKNSKIFMFDKSNKIKIVSID